MKNVEEKSKLFSACSIHLSPTEKPGQTTRNYVHFPEKPSRPHRRCRFSTKQGLKDTFSIALCRFVVNSLPVLLLWTYPMPQARWVSSLEWLGRTLIRQFRRVDDRRCIRVIKCATKEKNSKSTNTNLRILNIMNAKMALPTFTAIFQHILRIPMMGFPVHHW